MWEFYGAVDAILGHKPATQSPVVVQSLEEVQASASITKDSQLPDAPTCSTSPDLFEETQVDAYDCTQPDTPVLKKRNRKWTRAEESTSHKSIRVQEESD